jgi:hypothetical protein
MDKYNKYTYIADAATTQVATGPAVLRKIIVGETAAGAISIIDNTTGSDVNVGVLKASIAEDSYEYNLACAKGIRIITAAASKITVVWSQ